LQIPNLRYKKRQLSSCYDGNTNGASGIAPDICPVINFSRIGVKLMQKLLAFATTAIAACIAITCITSAFVTWDTWAKTSTSAATAQTTVSCPADASKTCLDLNVYEALNIMPREDRPLLDPNLGAYYGGTSSPPNPLTIKPGESVTFFIGPQYFLPRSYTEGNVKYVPHVGAGPVWPIKYPGATVYTNNKITFNSGDSVNPQEVKKEFGHAGVKDDPPSPTSAQYLVASGPITYNNTGEFVATARMQMIRHFYIGCSPANWYFVPEQSDICTAGQSSQGHSTSEQDKLIDITVSRLIKVVP
jgi:hypothetical protein